jgi:hypothetical protein
VWDDRHGESFYNCPRRFITDDIVEWYQEYLYDIEIGTPLNYSDQSSKYTEAWMLYKHFFNRYQTDAISNRNKSDTGALDMLEAGYLNRKRGENVRHQ